MSQPRTHQPAWDAGSAEGAGEHQGAAMKNGWEIKTIIKAKNTRIPVPSLAEPQRIVGILDEALDGIASAKANSEKNLQNARALFASHLQSVFTQRGERWVEKPLSELCDIKHGFAFKSLRGDRYRVAGSASASAVVAQPAAVIEMN